MPRGTLDKYPEWVVNPHQIDVAAEEGPKGGEPVKRARSGSIVTVDESEPEINVEPTDESFCFVPVWAGEEKGWQEHLDRLSGFSAHAGNSVLGGPHRGRME